MEKISGSPRTVAAVLVATAGVAYSLVYYKRRYIRNLIKAKAQDRRQRAQKSIDDLQEELKYVDINWSLVELSFEELQKQLQKGAVTATEVLRAYQAKALQVNASTNAIVEIVANAKEVAAELDKLPPEQRGPLHGIPISIKEACGLKDYDLTAGLTVLADLIHDKDSVLIQTLRSKGAVPFIRTNVPQGCLSISCDNGLYGTTANPHDPKRGPGGSSGGEGAIIGGQGSILGVGSDIGGSVRIPAAFSGCCTIKPTCGRLGFLGNADWILGSDIILPTDGPMGRDVESVVQFMRSVLDVDLWTREPSIPRAPFDEELFSSKRRLRVGFFLDNGCTRAVPAVERAVLEAKSLLEGLGHEVVEFDVKKHASKYFLEAQAPLLFIGDGQDFKPALEYDTATVGIQTYMDFCRPRQLFDYIVSKFKTYDPIEYGLLTRKRLRTMNDWFKINVDVRLMRQEFASEMISRGVDIILSPVMPCPAVSMPLDARMLGLITYTGLYNTLNLPAGVVQVTTVTRSDVSKTNDPTHYPANKPLEQIIQKDSEGSEGLPVAVQLAGLPWTDELVLRVMAELETAVKSKTA